MFSRLTPFRLAGAAAWLALLLGSAAAFQSVAAFAGPAQAGGQRAAPAPSPTPHAQASDAEIAGFFDAYMTDATTRLGLPGGAMVVVRDGRPILAKGYGVADVATRRPVEVEKSLFRAASISKLLPWLLVMQLVEDGRLDLDRDVNNYLDFRIPEAFGRPITMRDLMTHSAGFPERFNGVFDPDLATPLGAKLRDNIPERVYAPGTTIAYSNYGAALAGYIVQRLRGQPWDRVVAERIFAPLGMRHSTVLQPVPAALRARLVSTYVDGSDRPGEFRVTPLAPMGSLTPTAGDMGRLLAMLTAGGRGAYGQVVAPATLQRMFALARPLGPGLDDGFGLGFLVGRYHGIRYAGHAGNMTTLATDLEVLPELGIGYYYVFNSQGPGEAARRIRDELLMRTIDRFATPPAAAPSARGPSSARDVAGSYVSTRRIFSGPLMFSGLMNTSEAVAEPDGSLTVESSGTITHWLPAGRDRFVDAKTGIPLAVTRGADGRVARIASAHLYPAAVFERAPRIVAWIPFVAAFSFAILFLALPAKGLAWAIGRRRLRKAAVAPAAAASALPLLPPAQARLRRAARIAFRTIVVTLLGWATFGIAIAVDFGALFAMPSAVRLLLGLLSLLSAPLAIILLADAMLAWRRPRAHWALRIGRALLAAAALGLAWLFYTLDVVNFSGNW